MEMNMEIIPNEYSGKLCYVTDRTRAPYAWFFNRPLTYCHLDQNSTGIIIGSWHQDKEQYVVLIGEIKYIIMSFAIGIYL